ncbi:MAG: FHA domain-containing protein [Myxococcota bacterium]|jgi:hypothetical protein|nr:FHA domain-containing protein [Myxococcota bacterium]
MKLCENCFEQNSDGATHCVICGETMSVQQVLRQEAAEEPALEVEVEVVEAMIEGESSSAEMASEPERDQAEIPTEVSLSQELKEVDESPSEPSPKKAKAKAKAKPKPKPKEKKKKVAVSAEPSQEAEGLSAVLEVYHDSEPQVVHVHPIVNDITLVGREDPQRDVFPDLDLSPLESMGVSVKRASREHMRVLRRGDQFFLYVYRGTTGTQVNKEIVDESRWGKKFEIQVGDRIILGGKVRLKLAQRE